MQIQIRVENGRIIESRFVTDGCGTSIACGSMLTEIVKDKTIEEALMITSGDLLRSLDKTRLDMNSPNISKSHR